MRQFNLVFKNNDFIINEDGEIMNHEDHIVYTFSPEHSKDITANEFLEMMLACVSKKLSECDEMSANYIKNNLLDENIDVSEYTLESIEEINA